MQLLPQIPILHLQLSDPVGQGIDLLFGTDAELLDDLEHTPQTQHDDQGADFCQHAAQTDVDYEACDDDERVEAVERGFEEAGCAVRWCIPRLCR